ncbi:unnamed protein product [Phytophthora fragariaefolia]|uniref:Unnamed protein product n=1 Tax=Phytophthora fragariaefolia TaxID=1490495 RepID=A0A9W7CV66_9STRA|nr:unnamed protein product [Phytophthora fragariaefolia]
MVQARDELEALFDIGSDAAMEEDEEDEETSSSIRDDLGVGSRRPGEDDSERSRSGIDRPIASAGPLSTLSGIEGSRTGPVCNPWMPTPRRSNLASAVPLRRVRIRRLPVEAECPNGRHSVKAGVLSLKTSTALATVSAFA